MKRALNEKRRGLTTIRLPTLDRMENQISYFYRVYIRIQQKLPSRLLSQARSSSYDLHCETPFEVSLKLSKETVTTFPLFLTTSS